MNPNFAEGYNNRANARFVKGDNDAALADYNKALEIDPRYAEIYANRGIVWLRMGQKAKADADFAACLALKPGIQSSLERCIKVVQTASSNQLNYSHR